jgi:hypothetical protein
MCFRRWQVACRLLSLAVLAFWAGQQSAQAGDLCDFCCPRFHCPPKTPHCWEGAPRFHFKQGCPKPICNPCAMPNWGYNQTCWTPWPWPHNWSHCPVVPPAALVAPGVIPQAETMAPGPGRPNLVSPDPGSGLPTPRTLDRPPGL